jgi:hypothetical protein
MNYENRRFHALLDWRLGITYLRMLLGQQDTQILEANHELTEFQEFNGGNNWFDGVRNELNRFMLDFDLSNDCEYTYVSNQDYPVLYFQKNRNGMVLIILPYHPLWNPNRLTDNLLISEAITTIENDQNMPQYEIKYLDTFNLFRRPNECFKQLF